jgi:hypothetical protein
MSAFRECSGLGLLQFLVLAAYNVELRTMREPLCLGVLACAAFSGFWVFVNSCFVCRLAGDFGFDPLGLGSDPRDLRWYVQAELVHARFAMAGVAGILFTDVCMLPNSIV